MKANTDLALKCVRLQAIIDDLMLTYCPERITPEQLENWGDGRYSLIKQLTKSPQTARKFLQDVGIVGPDEKLSENYRS